MPQPSSTPRRKFSTTMSLCATRRRKAARPSGCFRSRLTPRLLRLVKRKNGASSPSSSGDGDGPAAERIAIARRFDLDDVGAEVRQQGGGRGAGRDDAEVEHPATFEAAGSRYVLHPIRPDSRRNRPDRKGVAVPQHRQARHAERQAWLDQGVRRARKFAGQNLRILAAGRRYPRPGRAAAAAPAPGLQLAPGEVTCGTCPR